MKIHICQKKDFPSKTENPTLMILENMSIILGTDYGNCEVFTENNSFVDFEVLAEIYNEYMMAYCFNYFNFPLETIKTTCKSCIEDFKNGFITAREFKNILISDLIGNTSIAMKTEKNDEIKNFYDVLDKLGVEDFQLF